MDGDAVQGRGNLCSFMGTGIDSRAFTVGFWHFCVPIAPRLTKIHASRPRSALYSTLKPELIDNSFWRLTTDRDRQSGNENRHFYTLADHC